MNREAFKASGYAWRLYTGPQAIERGIGESVDRARAKRAFVVCSPSVNNKTTIVRRIEAELGDRFAGVFDGIEKDSTYRSVVVAKEAAEKAGADLLIGVGGGSVLVATRVVAVYMGEDADPFEIMTQYPEGKAAYSPRLMAPKPPIFNIPTTPTSAMNRGGSGLKNPDLDHRMEYFDPKTRPQSIFIDDDALLSAPKDLIRSTATTVFASLIGAMSQTDLNALAHGDQKIAYGLAYPAYMRLMDELDNPQLRVDLAMAAFLQNRAEDDGRRRFTTNAFAGNYAVSTALHLRYPKVGQGESTSVVHASSMRLAETPDLEPAQKVALALEVWQDGMDASAAVAASADKLEEVYTRVGVPTALSQLDIPRNDLINIAKETIKNFNANAGTRSPEEQVASAIKLLEKAW